MIDDYLSAEIQADAYGCLSRLWDRAIERNGLHRPFTDWWVRAALAKGHAEWLLRERKESTIIGHVSPIESWRLFPPGSIGQYDNSCLTWSLLFLHIREGKFQKDLYGTCFNLLSEDLRGRSSHNFGWPHHSFVYGAPVRSWASNHCEMQTFKLITSRTLYSMLSLMIVQRVP